VKYGSAIDLADLATAIDWSSLLFGTLFGFSSRAREISGFWHV
jgi:hypothetical protein